MSVIDVNTMIGPWPTHKLEFSTPAELIQKMDHYGIDIAYSYSSYAVKVNPIDGNYLLVDQLKGYGERLKPCWVVMPTWDIECELPLEGELMKYGVRMVRMMPSHHGYTLAPWVCGELYELLQRNRIPLLLDHSEAMAGELHTIAEAYPALPIIITQCDYTQNRTLYRLLALHPNIFLEISTYYIYGGVEDIVFRFGAERMVFGSRMPFQEGAAALGMVLATNIAQADREKILGGNISELLKGR